MNGDLLVSFAAAALALLVALIAIWALVLGLARFIVGRSD